MKSFSCSSSIETSPMLFPPNQEFFHLQFLQFHQTLADFLQIKSIGILIDTMFTYSETPEVPILQEQGLMLSFQTLTHFQTQRQEQQRVNPYSAHHNNCFQCKQTKIPKLNYIFQRIDVTLKYSCMIQVPLVHHQSIGQLSFLVNKKVKHCPKKEIKGP